MVHQPNEVKEEEERAAFIKMMMPETEETISKSSG
jgi:hypothetical protein